MKLPLLLTRLSAARSNPACVANGLATGNANMARSASSGFRVERDTFGN